MRSLIFGGTGMLGGALVREGRRRGLAVYAPSRSQADVSDRERVSAACRAFRPQAIVNCAAFTRVDDCETRRDHAMAINGEAVANLVAAAREQDAALVQVSTDYVFDGRGDRPYREHDPTGPLSAYGASKLEGERQALVYERALVLRTSWLFGPGGPNFVTAIAGRLDAGADLRVVGDQIGCPTYTRSLARAILDLLARERWGVLHYRDRDPVSWHGFAREIARLRRPGASVVEIPTHEMERPAPRPAYSVLDVERTQHALGRPVEPWSSGLAEYLGTWTT